MGVYVIALPSLSLVEEQPQQADGEPDQQEAQQRGNSLTPPRKSRGLGGAPVECLSIDSSTGQCQR